MKHKHHIIPKHIGGTDDPSNIIKLSVKEHAEAHHALYNEYGRLEDYIAWRGLAGIIGKEELVREMCSLAGKKSNKKRIETKTHLWLDSEHQRQKQLKRLQEGRHNFSSSLSKEVQKQRIENGTHHFITCNPVYKQIENGTNAFVYNNPTKKKIQCPHCNKIGPMPQMKQWHFDKCKEKSH